MESVLARLLVDQIKKKDISARELHKHIESLCDNNNDYIWLSLSTLERRIQNPDKITDSEFILIRDALKAVLSGSDWMHLKRYITDKVRRNYVKLIDEALSYGFALHQNLVDYDNSLGDSDFVRDVTLFFRSAPEDVRTRWLVILPVYLMLPDLAKASLLCCSYIGKSVENNKNRNNKILQFIDGFPMFQGVNVISRLSDKQILSLSGILQLSASPTVPQSTPDIYRRYAIDKSLIQIHDNNTSMVPDERNFMNIVTRYRHSITDYPVTAEDFIRGLCFTLYIDRIEWLLAYTTSVVFYNMNEMDSRLYKQREYHDRGCTGFRFTDKELDYLCCLLYELGIDA